MYDNQMPRPAAEDDLLHLKKCRHGHFLYFPHDFYIGGALEAYGEYAEIELEFLCRMLFTGDTAIDAGANIGTLTLGMAQKVGMGGRIYAFEPQRIIHNMLCANLALNCAWNVHAFHAGLGSTYATLGVPPVDYTAPGNFGGVELAPVAMPEMVHVTTIDHLDLPQCRLIKADVQGMEAAVINGALHTIARCEPFLYVENDSDSDELPSLITDLGYDVYEHKTPLFNPNNFFSRSDNLYPNIVSYNMLGVPHGLKDRVKVELKPWAYKAR